MSCSFWATGLVDCAVPPHVPTANPTLHPLLACCLIQVERISDFDGVLMWIQSEENLDSQLSPLGILLRRCILLEYWQCIAALMVGNQTIVNANKLTSLSLNVLWMDSSSSEILFCSSSFI